MEALAFAEIIEPLLKTAALIIGGLLLRRLSKPSDKARAEHLALIAGAAAALVRSKYPNATWSQLLQETVREISMAAGLPTRNGSAINRAAAEALSRLGTAAGQ